MLNPLRRIQTPTPVEIPTPTIVEYTTYEGDLFEYSVKYPSDFIQKETQTNSNRLNQIFVESKNGKNSLYATANYIRGFKIQEYVDKEQLLLAKLTNNNASSSKTTINNVDFYVLSWTSAPNNNQDSATLTKKYITLINNVLYSFQIITNDVDTIENINISNDIINSIKITRPDDNNEDNSVKFYNDSEQKIKIYLDNNITNNMTQMEKVEKICEYVASFDYNGNYVQLVTMIRNGGGDCWASTETVNYMCQQVGINANKRDAKNDVGAASGHVNSLVEIDGINYVVDVGYSGKAPRFYSITLESEIKHK